MSPAADDLRPFRPRLARTVSLAIALVVLVLTALLVAALRHVPAGDRTGIALVGLAVAWFCWREAAVSARPDERGLTVRNLVLGRRLEWAEIVDVRTALADANPDVAPLYPYTAAAARGVGEHTAHIDDLISSHLQGWTLDRLPAVDRAILRVAVWELMYADDVPEPVAEVTPLAA